jgi:hypothetical protein
MKALNFFRYIALCLAAGLILFSGCSENPPVIQQVTWQLNLVDDRESGLRYEALSLWVHSVDDDGQDDIETVYLINDERELLWELNSETWAEVDKPGETWLGSSRIHPGDGSSLPRGEYRVIVTDVAGERDRRAVIISVGRFDKDTVPVPELSFTDEGIEVVNLGGKNYKVWIFDGQKRHLQTLEPSSSVIPFSELLQDSRVRETGRNFYLYTYDHDLGIGIQSGPYLLSLRDDDDTNGSGGTGTVDRDRSGS